MSDVEDDVRHTIRRWADSIEVDVPKAHWAPSYVRSDSARHQPPRRRLVAVAAAAALLVGAVLVVLRATGESYLVDSPHLEDPAPSTTAPVGSIEGFMSVEPLGDFMARGASGGRSYDGALNHRIGDCMTALGWQYPLADYDPSSAGEPTDPNELLQFRQTYGYGLLNGHSGDTHLPDQHFSMYQSFSPTDRARFDNDLGQSAYDEGGTPIQEGSGCTGAAEQEHYPHFPSNNPALLFETSSSRVTETQDPRYVAALDAWRACMSEAGYEYTSEGDARREVSDVYVASGGSPTDEQRAQAQAIGAADATCASRTLWPARSEIETEIIERLVAEYGNEATCGEEC